MNWVLFVSPNVSYQMYVMYCWSVDNKELSSAAFSYSRHPSLTLCSPLVSPLTYSVSMQSSSSNSSRDAHERSWSAKGSCHVSLCFKPVIFLICCIVNCVHTYGILLHLLPEMHILCLWAEVKLLTLSWYYSIRQHHCQRLMGLLHNTNAELCVYGRLIHTLNVPCAIIYLTILIYGTGYIVKLYLSVRVWYQNIFLQHDRLRLFFCWKCQTLICIHCTSISVCSACVILRC